MKYPSGIKPKNISKDIKYDNRGMTLEKELNSANEYIGPQERDHSVAGIVAEVAQAVCGIEWRGDNQHY